MIKDLLFSADASFTRKRQTTTPIDIGLVGFGKIGQTAHFPVLTQRRQRDFHLVGIADPITQQRRGITVLPSLDGLLEIPTLKAVSIATPPDQHRDLATKAIEAGRAVLLEKPPGRDAEELRYMQDAAEGNGVALFTAYHARYGRVIRFAQDYLAKQKRKGVRVESVGIFYNENFPNYHDLSSSWVIQRDRSGGGATRDSGLNALSAVHEILQEDFVDPEIADALFWRPKGYRNPVTGETISFEVETRSSIDFTLGRDNKIHGHLKQDWLTSKPEERRIEIHTAYPDDKVYSIDLIHKTVTVKDKFEHGKEVVIFDGNAKKRTRVDRIEEYTGVYQDFSALLQSGALYVEGSEMDLIDAAYLRTPNIYPQTLRNYDSELWRQQNERFGGDRRVVIATRMWGPFPEVKINPTVTTFAGAAEFGPALVITDHSYGHVDALSEATRKSGKKIALEIYDGTGTDNGGMLNFAINTAQKDDIPHFGIVSADLVSYIPQFFPMMLAKLDLDKDLSMVGLAIDGVHDMELLTKIQNGEAHLSPSNYARILPNNSFCIYRTPGTSVGRNIPKSLQFLQHPRSVGELYGRHEDIDFFLRSLGYGKTLLLVGNPPPRRDPTQEVRIENDKNETRQAAADLYKEKYGITDVILASNLSHQFKIEFMNQNPVLR